MIDQTCDLMVCHNCKESIYDKKYAYQLSLFNKETNNDGKETDYFEKSEFTNGKVASISFCSSCWISIAGRNYYFEPKSLLFKNMEFTNEYMKTVYQSFYDEYKHK